MTTLDEAWASAPEDVKREVRHFMRTAVDQQEIEAQLAGLQDEAEAGREIEVVFHGGSNGWRGAAADGSPLAKCLQVHLRYVARGLDLILPMVPESEVA